MGLYGDHGKENGNYLGDHCPCNPDVRASCLLLTLTGMNSIYFSGRVSGPKSKTLNPKPLPALRSTSHVAREQCMGCSQNNEPLVVMDNIILRHLMLRAFGVPERDPNFGNCTTSPAKWPTWAAVG